MAADNVLSDFLEPQGYQEVQLHKSAVGHFEVDTVVNGHDVLMIIDRGAAKTVLDKQSATELGLDGEACGTAVGAGGSLPVSMTDIEELSIQSVRLGPMTSVPVVDLSHCNTAMLERGARRVGGVIGADILSEKSAIIQYANNTLYLKD